VLHHSVARGEPGAHFVGVVVERPHSPAVRDAPGFVDNVEALGPCRIRGFGGVVDVVDAEGDGVVEALYEIVGDGHALAEVLRLRVANVLLHIGFHLPLIRGMSFAHIDGQEIGVILVIVVNLHHVTDVAAERRSSVTAEDDDKWSPAGAFANVEAICTIESHQPSVRRVVADFQSAAVHVREGIPHHAVNVLGAASHLAKDEEDRQQEHQENGNGPFPKKSHSKVFQPSTDFRTRDSLRTIISNALTLRKTTSTVAKRSILAPAVE
jgi:hypothetical protein